MLLDLRSCAQALCLEPSLPSSAQSGADEVAGTARIPGGPAMLSNQQFIHLAPALRASQFPVVDISYKSDFSPTPGLLQHG